MEKDYIHIYEMTYRQELLNQEQFIKKKFAEFDFDEDANFNLNTLNYYLEDQIKNSIVLKEPYDNLTSFFKNKAMARGKKLKIIPKHLIPMYNNLDKDLVTHTFTDFIEELAIYNARYEANRVFIRLRSLLFLMHSVKDFSEFQLNEKLAGENTSLYEKYRLMVYEPQQTNIDELEGSFKNNFQLTTNFIKIFSNRDFYDALEKAEVIDTERTKFEDFQNVFFLDPIKHNSDIYFLNDDHEAMYLLYYIGKKKKNQLSQTDISKSQRFKGYDGKVFTQYSIARSKNQLNSKTKSGIERFIDEHL